MIITTTQSKEGQPARQYLGLVMGESIVGALRGARQEALHELATNAANLGADAVLAVDIDYEVVGSRGSMLMVTGAGTAVKLS